MYSLLLVFFSIVLESFPISSSGNILLIKHYMQNYFHIVFDTVMLDDLNYLVHGAIACVIALFFFKRWIRYITTFPRSLPIIAKVIALGFITESITLICYLVISLFDIRFSLISVDFIMTSCALISLRYCPKKENVTWNWFNALWLGLAQGIALLPGISRFGLTFVAARWLGFANKKAFELSFLIGWPINLAACSLGLVKLYQHNLLEILNFSMLFIMMIASGVSLISLYGVSRLINAYKLWIFSGYTMALAIITFLF